MRSGEWRFLALQLPHSTYTDYSIQANGEVIHPAVCRLGSNTANSSKARITDPEPANIWRVSGIKCQYSICTVCTTRGRLRLPPGFPTPRNTPPSAPIRCKWRPVEAMSIAFPARFVDLQASTIPIQRLICLVVTFSGSAYCITVPCMMALSPPMAISRGNQKSRKKHRGCFGQWS